MWDVDMNQYDVFISYRREGGWPVGQLLYSRLSLDGYHVFYDIESMRSGKFNDQIYDSIDRSNTMVVILPPHALDRCVNEDDWVRKEIRHGIEQHKTLIPVFMQGFNEPDYLPDDIKDLLSYQGVTAENNISFDYWYTELKGYINEHLDQIPAPLITTHADQSVHQAELTDQLIHACQENDDNTVLALIDKISNEAFLNEGILDVAISHFIDHKSWDIAKNLIEKMLVFFPESESGHICVANHLLNDFPEYHLDLIRKCADWLIESSPMDSEYAGMDILADLLANHEENALKKLTAYKAHPELTPEINESASLAFYTKARSYVCDPDGTPYFTSKEDYQMWKHFWQLSIAESNDASWKQELQKTFLFHSVPWFTWKNAPALLLLFILAFSLQSPWNWLCRILSVIAVIFSIIPAWMKDYYRVTKDLIGFRSIFSFICQILGFPVLVLISLIFPDLVGSSESEKTESASDNE